MECKLRCVNFRRVSDPRRAFRPTFRVTGISHDWYRSTMGVIVISLRTPRSAGENFGITWERRRQVWERRRQVWERRRQVWERRRQVWERRQQAWERRRQAWERRREVSEHLESQYSSLGKTTSSLGTLLVRLEIIATTYDSTIFKTHVFSLYSQLCINVSMYLYSYPSTHVISGLAAGGA